VTGYRHRQRAIFLLPLFRAIAVFILSLALLLPEAAPVQFYLFNLAALRIVFWLAVTNREMQCMR